MMYPHSPPEDRAAYLYGLLTPCGKFKIGRTTNYMRALGKQHELKKGKVVFIYYDTDFFHINDLEYNLIRLAKLFLPTVPGYGEVFDLTQHKQHKKFWTRLKGWVSGNKLTNRRLSSMFKNMWSYQYGWGLGRWQTHDSLEDVEILDTYGDTLKSPRILGVVA